MKSDLLSEAELNVVDAAIRWNGQWNTRKFDLDRYKVAQQRLIDAIKVVKRLRRAK